MRPYWINSASTAMGLGNHPLSPRGLIWINGRQARHWPDHCATIPRATVMSAAERALGIKMPQGR
jgi:hypothetical protein